MAVEHCPDCGEPITYVPVAVVCSCVEEDEDDELIDDEGPE